MPDMIGQAWHQGWRGRWFLIGAGALLAVLLMAWGRLAWPFALGAGLALVAAGHAVRMSGPAAGGGEASEPGRPAPSRTDLTIEGLIGALPEPAILVDARLSVRSFNAAASQVASGLRRGEPLTLALREPGLIEAVRRAVSAGTAQVSEFEERVPVSRWFRAVAAPLAVTARARDGGEPDFVLLTLSDLSEEKRLERLRADFVANASHELRTPLASVVGFIETIQGPARNDPAATERFLGIMLSQAQRMARLIDDLLSLSRVELNEHVRPSGRVDLVALIGHVRDTLGPFARSLEVSVEVTADEPSLIVTGDQDELIRLFENLVQNAIKYGAEGRRVEIGLSREPREGRPDEVAVAIRDFGPGIPAEHLPRLTERFYRVDVASSREKGGTGLGLALVKHILNRHRGRLAIESRQGEGATFTVRLEGAAVPSAGPGRSDAAQA